MCILCDGVGMLCDGVGIVCTREISLNTIKIRYDAVNHGSTNADQGVTRFGSVPRVYAL